MGEIIHDFDEPSEAEIPRDNEEFNCPACKGTHLVFGAYFLAKHLREHHEWSDKAARSYVLYRDTPAMLAAVAQRRTKLIKETESKHVISKRATKSEADAFLKLKSESEFNKRAEAILRRAGVFQGTLEETLRAVGYNRVQDPKSSAEVSGSGGSNPSGVHEK